ncbi:MAG: cysteine--tRNA ligase [Epsilonproteobacteria bacterium]|nr:cysteine--tRNA ligase [Campylobacterota bacterium]|tara:strand:- start:3111 stop:4445 length:1335 start_codon:yes stop_codon:yes gene_type:complete
MLLFTNTLTRKKEKFLTAKDKPVSLYVCGITPYDFAHIGHGRCYVTFDLVYRLLKFLGYEVTYCRNFTDIDDKILKRSEQELGDMYRYAEITQKYIDSFLSDMKQLQCLNPTIQPRVTEMIPQIISFIQGLIDKKAAYESQGSVYFRVSSYQEYGKLSKQNIKQLQSGARIQVDDTKEDPLDFALWKKDEKVGFQSPWGQGRPGWHIECSAMAQDVFQDTVDIHGGGIDLLFPHHENEIAQSESLYNRSFVNYWLHNAFVQINKEKMSKSLGNYFTLQDMFKEFDPMVIRFYFLKHHYRNPLEFAVDDLKAAETTYKRLVNAFKDVSIESIDDIEQVRNHSVVAAMLEYLQDDMNTSGALGVLFEKLSLLQDDHEAKSYIKYLLVHVFGLTLQVLPEKKVIITPEIQNLINQREQARANKDWTLADKLRDQLQAMGVVLQDKKL